MASKVTNDFKAAFALLLTIMKVNYTTTTALNYSQTVYEWTLAGLVTEGIIKQVWDTNGYKIVDVTEAKKYAGAFTYARERYREAIELLQNQATDISRKSYIQSQILDKCFDINQAIFPIALSEGLLDLKDIAAGIGAGAASIPVGREQ